MGNGHQNCECVPRKYTKVMQIVGRLRGNRNIEHSKALIIDAAIYACKPVTSTDLKEHRRTPLQRYIRHLLFECLDKKGEPGEGVDVLQKMRGLPWHECELYVLKVTLKVCRLLCLFALVCKLRLRVRLTRPQVVTGGDAFKLGCTGNIGDVASCSLWCLHVHHTR
jgi:hypothetical protein